MKKAGLGDEFYKAIYVPTLMYGDETWVVTKRSLRSVEPAETRFLRLVKVAVG
jgi:hypothetical protein